MTSDRAHGFTLLEMLVVLLIAGIALALASQALGQYQRAHTRAIASERLGREQRLSELWFRDSVRGLFPAATTAEARGSVRLVFADISAVPAGAGQLPCLGRFDQLLAGAIRIDGQVGRCCQAWPGDCREHDPAQLHARAPCPLRDAVAAPSAWVLGAACSHSSHQASPSPVPRCSYSASQPTGVRHRPWSVRQ